MTRSRALPKDAKRRTIWIDEALWSKIVRASKEDERTASAWIRRALMKALGI